MRDKQFVINSIKMDLHRVVTAAGDITKPFPLESVKEFLQHALNDFIKVDLTASEKNLQNELNSLSSNIKDFMTDPIKRLRWTEKVMTVRCRL